MIRNSNNISFCIKCGAGLEVRHFEDKQRSCCLKCGWIHYEQLKVGVGALIELDNRLLLIQRTHEPYALHWNLPAGYVDADESPRQALIREVREETGLHADIISLRDAYFFDDDPRGNGILIAYRCGITDGELSESSEGKNPTYFASHQIPDKLAGGGHDLAISAWSRKLETAIQSS